MNRIQFIEQCGMKKKKDFGINEETRLDNELAVISLNAWSKMSYAKLLKLDREISDSEIISILNANQEVQLDNTIISSKIISEKGVSGDFGEMTPR